MAKAIHKIDPKLEIGGPCYQSPEVDVRAWPDRPAEHGWLGRFLRYLRGHGRERDFAFFSTEWYPFDDVCGKTAPQLAGGPALLAKALDRLRKDGLSKDIPWLLTEY